MEFCTAKFFCHVGTYRQPDILTTIPLWYCLQVRQVLTLEAASRYCLLLESCVNILKRLSCSTYTPWWLVRRLSICFLYILIQKSLQTNFIVSNSSLYLGLSFVILSFNAAGKRKELL